MMPPKAPPGPVRMPAATDSMWSRPAPVEPDPDIIVNDPGVVTETDDDPFGDMDPGGVTIWPPQCAVVAGDDLEVWPIRMSDNVGDLLSIQALPDDSYRLTLRMADGSAQVMVSSAAGWAQTAPVTGEDSDAIDGACTEEG